MATHPTATGDKILKNATIRKKFLKLYGETGVFFKSATAAGTSGNVVKAAMERDENFAEEVELARQKFADTIERAVFDRAVDGVDEPVYYQGKEVGKVRKYSDSLAALVLKRHRPEYRERQTVDLNASGGVLLIPSSKEVDPDEWEDSNRSGSASSGDD